MSYTYVADAIQDLKAEEQVRVLRIGFSHPMPAELIGTFLANCDKLLIVEEGEPYMEEAVKAIAQERGLSLPINGKGPTLFSRLYEFDPAMVRQTLAGYFGIACSPPAVPDLSDVPEIPQRPPTLCAGCSHRAAFYAVKKATEGLDVIYPSDIGCYTLGFLPPLSMGDFVICMGASTGSAGGFAQATSQKVVSFIGDSIPSSNAR